MKTVCPECHKIYEVPDDYLDQTVTCTKCQKNFTVTKAKFCSECGAANFAQAVQCYACQHPFQLQTCADRKEMELQHSVSPNPDDRSKTKLKLPIKIIVMLFGVGCLLCVLAGINMIFSCFLEKSEGLTGKAVYLVVGCLGIAVYGRLAMLISTLTQPKLKARQTLYTRLALLGGIIFSIIGLIYSFQNSNFMLLIANVLILALYYLIFRLWNKRCAMDMNYKEPEKFEKSENTTFTYFGILFGILGFIPVVGLVFAVTAIFFGTTIYRKGRKVGLIGMSLGIVTLIGNIVYMVMKSRLF